MATSTVVSDLEAPGAAVAPRHGFAATAFLGAGGSALLALASDLPASPFGPRAGGVWPFAASGVARSWEGPSVPAWAAPANSGPGVPTGHLLVLAAALLGLGLLGVAWLRLWRAVRADENVGLRDVWWVCAAWTAPLLFAVPFASQDVWVYVAQGKVVASGMSAATPLHTLGPSAWVSAVDPKYLKGGSIYGPGANDLSALFARVSGGHPWIAVEGWRLAVIASMVLCGWGVARIAAARGANPVEAVVAGVANPAVLIAFVAGAHNDALMIGLVVAGVALAVTGRRWWGLAVLALAVTVKAPAALAVLAVAWWCWKGSWYRRALAVAAGMGATLVALSVTGLFSGGGFSWLKSASVGTVASAFSLARFAGTTATGPVNLVQTLGILVAVALVLAVPRGRSWIGALAIGFGVMAVCSANPQPWYLLWAVPLVACTFTDGGVQRVALVVLCAMAAWSVLPLGPLAWFGGMIALAVIGFLWVRSWPANDASAAARRPAVVGDAF
ncbi:MAG TPA: polyprenol phosphomannose-dependent alpha 1,6 mannosyltransferase MptB [Acidimicrobiales bacterium]|nr:polyprenol phosphomannose-dependent alpha 1,6 mannosyltransferase MptB [Acidimicrobiales bacterium]